MRDVRIEVEIAVTVPGEDSFHRQHLAGTAQKANGAFTVDEISQKLQKMVQGTHELIQNELRVVRQRQELEQATEKETTLP